MLPSIPKGDALHQNSSWEPKTHIAAGNGGIRGLKKEKKNAHAKKKSVCQNRWRAWMLFYFFYSLINTK